MRVVDFSLLLVALLLVAQIVFGAEAPSEEPQGNGVPFNATNDSPAAAGIAFFTVGGIVILAQIAYCIIWTKKDAAERAKFNAEIEEAGLVGGEQQGSSIDMKHEA